MIVNLVKVGIVYVVWDCFELLNGNLYVNLYMKVYCGLMLFLKMIDGGKMWSVVKVIVDVLLC